MRIAVHSELAPEARSWVAELASHGAVLVPEPAPHPVPVADGQAEALHAALGAGDVDAWIRWWDANAFLPVFSAAPGATIPSGVRENPKAREALRDALRRRSRWGAYLDQLDPASAVRPTGPEGHGGGCLVGPDVVVSPLGGAGKVWLPPGAWVPLAGRAVPAAEGWASCPPGGGPVFQRDGSVVPRWGPQPRGPRDVELLVAPGGDSESVMLGGMSVRLRDYRLDVQDAPGDIVVISDGDPVIRIADSQARVDLHTSADARRVIARQAPGQERPLIDFEGLMLATHLDRTTGLRHRYDILPNPPADGEPAVLRVSSDEPLEAGWAYVTTDGSEPAGSGGRSPGSLVLPLAPHQEGLWTATVPGTPDGTLVRYRIEVVRGGESAFVGDAAPDYVLPSYERVLDRPHREVFSYLVGTPAVPRWIRDGVVYQVVIDRFAAPDGVTLADSHEVGFLGNGGGTLPALRERLPYIKELGADVLWLSPVHRGDMNVNYDVRDLFAVDERIGTEEDFRALCESAHELGMRVLLDIEFSYFGGHHPVVQQALHELEAPHRDWLLWSPDQRPYSFFGVPMLAAVDHANPGLRAHLLEAAEFWLSLGIDGFRLDSAHQTSHDFWTHFARLLRERGGELFNVVEATRPLDECLRFRGRTEGYLDFDVHDEIVAFLESPDRPLSLLDDVIAARDDLPDGIHPLNFLDNHDRRRVLDVVGEDRDLLRVALLLLMTLPGTPVVYYGTEVGLGQRPTEYKDEGYRGRMLWGPEQDHELLSFTQRVIALRKSVPPLRHGSRRSVLADSAARVYAYVREADDQSALVVLNFGDQPCEVTLPWDARTPVGRFGQAELTVHGSEVRVRMQARAGAVFVDGELT